LALSIAVDGGPGVMAGRAEDTINLLSHAARSIVRTVLEITKRPSKEICRKAGIPLLLPPSIDEEQSNATTERHELGIRRGPLYRLRCGVRPRRLLVYRQLRRRGFGERRHWSCWDD
jgi:hypothetical protein